MIPSSNLSSTTPTQFSLEASNDITPAKVGNRLYQATKSQDIESVRNIINSEIFQYVSGYYMGYSLEYASIHGYVEIAKELIESRRYNKIFQDVLGSCLEKSIEGEHLDIAYEILQKNESKNIPLETLDKCLTNARKENKIEIAHAIMQARGSTEKGSAILTSLEEFVAEMDTSKLMITLKNAVKINWPELASTILKTDHFIAIPSSELLTILQNAIINRRSDIIQVLLANDRFKQLLIEFSTEILQGTIKTCQWNFAKIILFSMKNITINEITSILSQMLITTSTTDSLEIAKIIISSNEFEKIPNHELLRYVKTAVNNHDSNLVEVFLANDRFKECNSAYFTSYLQIALYNNDWKTINALLPSIIQLDVNDLKLLLSNAMSINNDLSLQVVHSILESYLSEPLSSVWICSFFEKNIINNNWELVKAILSKKLNNLSLENLEMCLKIATDNEKEDVVLMVLTSDRCQDISSGCLTMVFERFATIFSTEIIETILNSRFNDIPPDLITYWYNQ